MLKASIPAAAKKCVAKSCRRREVLRFSKIGEKIFGRFPSFMTLRVGCARNLS